MGVPRRIADSGIGPIPLSARSRNEDSFYCYCTADRNAGRLRRRAGRLRLSLGRLLPGRSLLPKLLVYPELSLRLRLRLSRRKLLPVLALSRSRPVITAPPRRRADRCSAGLGPRSPTPSFR